MRLLMVELMFYGDVVGGTAASTTFDRCWRRSYWLYWRLKSANHSSLSAYSLLSLVLFPVSLANSPRQTTMPPLSPLLFLGLLACATAYKMGVGQSDMTGPAARK